jgi:hypothetical protein
MNTVKHTRSFQINQPAEAVFPLMSAEGEKLWVPDWDYTNIMGTTELHEDYVFLTESHDHGSTTAIWLVKRFQPEDYFVQFYKVEPGDKVGIVSVQCKALNETLSEVEVTYEYIALSAKGDHFIESFTAAAYKSFIETWKDLLEQYFSSIA